MLLSSYEAKSTFRENLLGLSAFIIKQERMKITVISRYWKKEQSSLPSKKDRKKNWEKFDTRIKIQNLLNKNTVLLINNYKTYFFRDNNKMDKLLARPNEKNSRQAM